MNNYMIQKPDDRLVYNKVLDQVFLCESEYKDKFSDFLYTEKAEEIVSLISRQSNVYFHIFGGMEGTSRAVIGMFAYEDAVLEESFPIVAVEISFTKFDKATNHRSVLGSIIGTGIDRGKVGDILVFEDKVVVFLSQDISAHVMSNLTYVGKSKVSVSIIDPNDVFVPLDTYKEITIKLDNPRLSSLIAKAFNISRETASKLIKAKKVSTNWAVESKDKNKIDQGVTISVRGHGKVFVNEVTNKGIGVHVYK